MTALTFDDHWLAPAIIQDERTGRVLMLGYVSPESLEATERTGQVHFWSRSRKRLWHKGESSGNTLTVRSITPDCDRDAILIRAVPAGPTCHTGSVSCFGQAPSDQGFAWMERLWEVISQRAEQRPDDSYTARLLAGGTDSVGRKVVEEATEVLLAAKDHAAGAADGDRLAEEAADLVYHLLVLLAERGVAAGRMIDVLVERHH